MKNYIYEKFVDLVECNISWNCHIQCYPALKHLCNSLCALRTKMFRD